MHLINISNKEFLKHKKLVRNKNCSLSEGLTMKYGDTLRVVFPAPSCQIIQLGHKGEHNVHTPKHMDKSSLQAENRGSQSSQPRKTIYHWKGSHSSHATL